MSWLLPLPVVIPLLAGALNTVLDHVAPKWMHHAVTLGAMATALGFSIVILIQSMSSETLHWFGGWTPRSGVALGIAFAADPLGAGAAVFTCALTLVALVYSVTFIEGEQRKYDVLMSAVCAAVCGFALSADIFNLFVWLELVGVAGYALTGFDVRRVRALQGALNFSIVNSVGGYFVLTGIGLLYARTGALDLAQIGRTLAGQHANGVVIVAMALIVSGFLCKAAVVPFHFWLADAYAVAPAPVCLVLAGILTDIGIFGIARVWFTVFDAPFGTHQRLVGDTLLWLGICTALLGGVMALQQSNVKRLLAYSVICHIGIILAGVALLSSKGVAGAATMVLAHGFLTGGLFLACGILVVRRAPRWLAGLWFAGTLALIGPPYIGIYLGHALIDDAAAEAGRHWPQPLLWLAGALAGAALLRAGVEVFWRGEHDDVGLEEPREARVGVLVACTALLLAAGAVTSLVPGLGQRAHYGADRFRARAEYADRVLHDRPMKTTPHLPVVLQPTSAESLAYASGATLLAVLVALLSLWRPRLARRSVLRPAVAGLRAVHSGVIGDYVTWMVVGTAVIGGVWAIGLR